MSKNQNKKASFLDKHTLIALLFVFTSWFLWEKYMRIKYPPVAPAPASAVKKIQNDKKEKTLQIKPRGYALNLKNGDIEYLPISVESVQRIRDGEFNATLRALNEAVSSINQKLKTKKSIKNQKERFLSFENKKLKLLFSSKGMGLKEVRLKGFRDRKKQEVQFRNAKGVYLFGIKDGLEDVYFKIRKVSADQVQGIGRIQGVRTKILITIKEFSLNYEVQFNKKPSHFFINTALVPKKGASGLIDSFLSGMDRAISLYVQDNEEEEERVYYAPEETTSLEVKRAEILGLGDQYFGQAFLNQSKILPTANLEGNDLLWKVVLEYEFPRIGSVSSLQYKVFFGPKSVETLKQTSPSLTSWINYGFFRPLCEFILLLLKWFYDFTKNWGVSIIILTFFVRILLFPLNRTAYKAMRVMKRIQPQIKEIRAKLKKEPKKMNQEVMALMKKEKASPFGSILPIFVQFPVFFALYRVLSESFELYQSPFIFWIQDLSTKDPYYILPILMGASMYLQQKITPTNMEPAQEKVLKFLPLIFTFFMVNLPSGLTLYIFVSTLFGLIQQYYFMRGDNQTNQTKQLKQKES